MKPFELRDYQKRGLDYYKRYRNGIAAWDMGTGKTLLAVEHARLNVKAERVLVVAPINTHTGWMATVERQWPDMPVTMVQSPDKSPDTWQKMMDRERGVYIVGWEVMRGWTEKAYIVTSWCDVETRKEYSSKTIDPGNDIYHEPPWNKTGIWDLVVADECHRMQNRKTASHLSMMKIKAERKMAMSGTWTGNRKEGAFGILKWLWPNKFPHFWPWVDRNFETTPDPYTYKRIVGELEPGKILKEIPCYMRVEADASKFQVAEHFVEVGMTPRQASVYKRFRDEAFAWLDDQPVGTPLPIVQRIRLRQVALGMPGAVTVSTEPIPFLGRDGATHFSTEEYVEVTFRPNSTSLKIQALKEIISDLPEGEPLMVYVHSKRFVAPVVHQLGKEAVAWTGDTPVHERMRILKNFGKPGGPRIIVAVIAAISEGVDGLQRVCANEVWLSQEDNNIFNEQAKARLLRMGQERMVNRWYLQVPKTIDVGVYVKNKLNQIQMIDFYKEERPQ